MMKMILLIVCVLGVGILAGCVVREGRHRHEVSHPVVLIPVPVPVPVPGHR